MITESGRAQASALENDIFAISIIAECQEYIHQYEADLVLEQVKLDAWERTYGHIIRDIAPEYKTQKELNEGLIADIGIAVGSLIPGIGSIVAAGGTAYYVYNMVRALSKGNNTQAFFEGLSAIFTAGQIIPAVGAAIGAAAKVVFAPFKIAFNAIKLALMPLKTGLKVLKPGALLKSGETIRKSTGSKSFKMMESLAGKTKGFRDAFINFFTKEGATGTRILRGMGLKEGGSLNKGMKNLKSGLDYISKGINKQGKKISDGLYKSVGMSPSGSISGVSKEAAEQLAKQLDDVGLSMSGVQLQKAMGELTEAEAKAAMALLQKSADDAAAKIGVISKAEGSLAAGSKLATAQSSKLVKAELEALEDAVKGYMAGAGIKIDVKSLDTFMDGMRKANISDDVFKTGKDFVAAPSGPFKGYKIKSIPKSGDKQYLEIIKTTEKGGITSSSIQTLNKEQAYIYLRSNRQANSALTSNLKRAGVGYGKPGALGAKAGKFNFGMIDKTSKATQVALRGPAGKKAIEGLTKSLGQVGKSVDDILNAVGPRMVDDFSKACVGKTFKLSPKTFATLDPVQITALGRTLRLSDDAMKQLARGQIKGLEQATFKIAGVGQVGSGPGLEGLKRTAFQIEIKTGKQTVARTVSAEQLAKFAPNNFLDDAIKQSKIVETYKNSVQKEMKGILDNLQPPKGAKPKPTVDTDVIPPATPTEVVEQLNSPKTLKELEAYWRGHLKDPDVIGMKRRTYFLLSGGIGVSTGIQREVGQMLEDQEALFGGVDPVTLSAEEMLMLKQIEGTDVTIPDFAPGSASDSELEALNEWLYINQRGRRRVTNIFKELYKK